MGFNTFAVFYEFITGRSDFGPHSIWVATLVETGIVGLAVYLAYFFYLVACAARDPKGDRSRHPGHGLGHDRRADRNRRGQLLLSDDVVRLFLRAGACSPLAGWCCSRRARVAYSPALATARRASHVIGNQALE